MSKNFGFKLKGDGKQRNDPGALLAFEVLRMNIFQ